MRSEKSDVYFSRPVGNGGDSVSVGCTWVRYRLFPKINLHVIALYFLEGCTMNDFWLGFIVALWVSAGVLAIVNFMEEK